jgi:hypothetical protein
MSSTLVQPIVQDPRVGTGRWMVTIFNNMSNSLDEVVAVLVRATGCSTEEAAIETWEAHVYGKAHVHFSRKAECERVAGIISSIGVKTEVTLEWED